MVTLALLVAVAGAQDVGVYGSPAAGASNVHVREYLFCSGRFVRVEAHDASVTTPTLAELQQYHAVLVYSDLPFADPVMFGDVLADYVEAGGGVVFAAGSFGSAAPIEGRVAVDHLPVTVGTLAPTAPTFTTLRPFAQASGYPATSGHPVVYGVNALEGGPYVQGSAEVAGAVRLAEWSDGEPAVVVYEPADPAYGDVVALNLYPPSSDVDPAHWTGNGDRLVMNALLWSGGFEKPPLTLYNTLIYQDYNCSGVDVSLELPVDLTDPVCLANVDPVTGAPYPNNDWYYDYHAHGCEVFVDPAMDLDLDLLIGDHFSGDGVAVGETWVSLRCDNCPYDFNPDQADIDLDGVGDLCDNCVLVPNHAQGLEWPCGDEDCFGYDCDNCPCTDNDDQSDRDLDGLGDVCDPCPDIFDPYLETTRDPDLDGFGDACDVCPDIFDDQTDSDFDNVGDLCDNCDEVVNPDQVDTDGDLRGDACDVCPELYDQDQTDTDGDGVGDLCDNCPVPNADQLDDDLDGVGDACDSCPYHSDFTQTDSDGDAVGDVCDLCPLVADDGTDTDEDGLGDACDVCPELADPQQPDRDGDLIGDACDTCPTLADDGIDRDDDGLGDVCDNCPDVPNDQADEDGDGRGDLCDVAALRGGGEVCGCATGPQPSLAWTVLLLAILRRRR